MDTPTEETRVDIIRPVVEGCDDLGEPFPCAALADDDDDDPETILLSRLAWPEPPRSLSERPKPMPARPALSRSVGGLSRSESSRRISA